MCCKIKEWTPTYLLYFIVIPDSSLLSLSFLTAPSAQGAKKLTSIPKEAGPDRRAVDQWNQPWNHGTNLDSLAVCGTSWLLVCVATKGLFPQALGMSSDADYSVPTSSVWTEVAKKHLAYHEMKLCRAKVYKIMHQISKAKTLVSWR